MNFTVVILAGGKSSRMGRDKARLEIDGEALLARQIRLARECGASEILVSAQGAEDYHEFGCRVLPDTLLNSGPLAGVERGLGASSEHLTLVLAVDMPGLTPNIVQELCANCSKEVGSIPRVDGQIEPLAAFYPRSAQSLAAELLRGNQFAMRHFASACVEAKLARFVELPGTFARFFANWNSPGDLPTPGGDICEIA